MLATIQPALAESDQRARAQSLFEEARAQMSQGDFGTACDKLAESQKLDPALGTLLNLALCNEQRGRTQDAWQQYTHAAARARVVGDPERERIANEGAARLLPSLRRLEVTVTGVVPAGAWLRIDDVPIDLQLLEGGIPIEFGSHELAWGAPGKRVFTERFQVSPGEGAQTFVVPALVDESELTSTVTIQAAPTPTPIPTPIPTRVRWPLVITAYGLSAVGASTAVVYGVKASQAWDERNRICEERCTLAAKQAGDRADSYAWVANGAGVLALAGAALGTFWLLSGGTSNASTHAALSAAPVPGGGYAQVRLTF